MVSAHSRHAKSSKGPDSPTCGVWRVVLTRGRGRSTRRFRDTSAEGGTRTPTGLRPLAPEASASTSSTTSARDFFEERQSRLLYNPKSMRILPTTSWKKSRSPGTRAPGKAKKAYDKREDLKRRVAEREMARVVKGRRS